MTLGTLAFVGSRKIHAQCTLSASTRVIAFVDIDTLRKIDIPLNYMQTAGNFIFLHSPHKSIYMCVYVYICRSALVCMIAGFFSYTYVQSTNSKNLY